MLSLLRGLDWRRFTALGLVYTQGVAIEDDFGFFALLAERADSPFNWTIDLSARRSQLKTEAQPYCDQAQDKRREAASVGQRLERLKALPRKEQDETAIAAADSQFKTLAKEARTVEGKAADLDNQLYDLKAVSPNRSADSDSRAPDDLLNFIEQKCQELAAVLAELRAPA
jgi:hypothetical protein